MRRRRKRGRGRRRDDLMMGWGLNGGAEGVRGGRVLLWMI